MTKKFMREDRYIVFKISDVVEHLITTERLHLERLYEIQRVGRREAGKSELECVVIESDWPEYEPTWRAIEARTTGAQPAPSVTDDELAEFAACQGAKCGCVDGYSHSPECVVEAAACQGWLNTPEAVDALLKVMVDRFLGWKLPKDFAPDCHVHFDREAADAFVESWPSGTNLLHAGQAMEMFKHCLPAELIISARQGQGDEEAAAPEAGS